MLIPDLPGAALLNRGQGTHAFAHAMHHHQAGFDKLSLATKSHESFVRLF